MFVICKKIFGAFTILCLIFLSSIAFARTAPALSNVPVSIDEAVCNSSGECSVDISDVAKDRLLACNGSKVSVSWNSRKQGSFLIACDCECTSHDNTGWLVEFVDAAGKEKAQGLYLGKAVTIEGMKQLPLRVPDMISSHRLCESIDSEKLSKSIFITLIKYPTSSEVEPYCFSPAYLLEKNGGIEISTNNIENGYGKLLYAKSNEARSLTEILRIIRGVL